MPGHNQMLFQLYTNLFHPANALRQPPVPPPVNVSLGSDPTMVRCRITCIKGTLSGSMRWAVLSSALLAILMVRKYELLQAESPQFYQPRMPLAMFT